MADTIKIFDTTLRDGEQSPGCSMNLEEKLRMAVQLAKLNVDVIEAGFPIASPGDFEAVHRIAKEVKGVTIAGLARANKIDIDRCWEAVKGAEKNRIHTFIATSPIHMKHKLRKEPDEVLKDAVLAVRHARKYTEDVEFSAEDATRSEPEFLVKVFGEVIEAGATTINVPDTVGYAVPSQFGPLIAYLRANIPNIGKAVISVHCHNDLGLAVANSLAAVENGARQVECTVNGIGERAGNASMEEIVMTLNVRKDKLPFKTRIRPEQIFPSSKLLTFITGISVQPNKAIVGENAFAHEAGIHQDGVLKYQQTYEIMTPESVGIPKNKLVLGKHSGRHAFRDRLNDLGTPLEAALLEQAFNAFKALADKKKNVYDEDIMTIVESLMEKAERYQFESLHVVSGTEETPKAMVRVKIDGESREVNETGDGPVDAVYRAIKKITGFKGALNKYVVNAITGETDAQGEVLVTLEDEGKTVRGTGAHTDIVVASALAFLSALNRLEYYQKKKGGKGI
ncbi:MAG: 2-isopropylmalate synthase [Deltaproteobacteria bacterium]|nr:2-isopropylmalate synthase [Deltaproteobacteria bacterium]